MTGLICVVLFFALLGAIIVIGAIIETVQRWLFTTVYMRSMKTPASHWEERVHYDAWGTPYVKCYGFGPSSSGNAGTVEILPGGKTSEASRYGTEWRHKSGPPVEFATKPDRPFP